MDTLVGIAVFGLWVAISAVGLKRAYAVRKALPREQNDETDDT